MIVLHSFFYKKHPKYLNGAVNLMRSVNNRCFVNHRDFDIFVQKIFERLQEDTDGRYEKGDVTLIRTDGQLQIEVKRGLDYAARIDFINVENGFAITAFSEKLKKVWRFMPDGEMKFEWEDEQ